MRSVECTACGKTDIPMGESYTLDDVVHCNECAEKVLSSVPESERPVVLRQVDPSICKRCGKDAGALVYEKIAGVVLCDDCYQFVRARPFPKWIYACLGAIALILLISYSLNAKYVMAYKYAEKGKQDFADGKYAEAAENARLAYEALPSIKGNAFNYHFSRALSLYMLDSASESIAEYDSARSLLSSADVQTIATVNRCREQSVASYAFDKQDYRTYCEICKQHYLQDSTSFRECATVASGYACLYAQRDDDSLKASAEYYLQRAKKLLADDTDPNGHMYLNRIEHRLYTRSVISHADFNKQFPTGWRKQ